MRSLKEGFKTPTESSKNMAVALGSKDNMPSPLMGIGEPSTEVSEKSDSNRGKESSWEKNGKVILQ